MPVTVTETLPVNRIEVETDNPVTAVTVTDAVAVERVAVTETGSDIKVTISPTASGVSSVNGLTGIVSIDTDDIPEGGNLYYTQARADARVAAGIAAINYPVDSVNGQTNTVVLTTTDIAEGTNKYYTDARVDDRIALINYPVDSVNGQTNTVVLDTDDVAEGATNQYFTNQRAIDAVGGSAVTITPARWNSPYTQNSQLRGFVQWAAGGTNNLNISNYSGSNDITALAVNGFSTHTTPLQKWTASGTTVASVAVDGTITASQLSLTTYPTTDNITEGTNKYYTDARVGTYLTTNNYATQSYVSTAISNLVDSAPTTLDTLNELAAALGDDANFATTVTTALGTKLATADFTSTADTWLATKTTDNVTQGSTNRYFSNTLARQALSAGTGISYDNTTGVITCTVTDTNTTYTQTASSVTGGANLNLVGSDSTTDTVKFNSGTGVTVSRTDADTIDIAIGQSVATSASPTFNNLTLTGGGITNTTTNGAVTLTPNGTGDLAVVLSNGGNLTNTRNYVMGAIRDTTTDTNGDAWSFVSGVTGYRGVTIDNSSATNKRPGVVIRSYGTGLASGLPRGGILTENSRGSAASPTSIVANDFIGEFIATGRTSTGWVSDLVGAVPAGQTFYATESWTALTNTGTGWALSLQPTATTLSGISRITVIDATPQAINTRADAYNFKSKANTNLVTVAGDGQLQVFNTNATNPNILYGYTTKIAFSTTENSYGNNITIKPGKLTGSNSYDRATLLSVIQNTSDGTDYASYEMKTQRFGGTNFSPAVNGDILGRLLFNGNYSSTTVPAVTGPGATVSAVATETWSSTAAGTKLFYTITKTGTNTNLTVGEFASTGTILQSDAYSFRDSSGTIYQDISNTKILNNRPHRSAVTTHSMARGSTYTPAVGVNNYIEVTLTAGTDPTYIDVDNLTVAGEGGHQAILVYNNSGSSVGNGDLVIRNNGTAINEIQNTIADGARVIFTVYCIGNYASCEYMTAA